MFDNIDLSVGGRSMQWGVALLILTGHFSTVVNEQCHNIQVALTKAAESIINLHRTFDDSFQPKDHFISPLAFLPPVFCWAIYEKLPYGKYSTNIYWATSMWQTLCKWEEKKMIHMQDFRRCGSSNACHHVNKEGPAPANSSIWILQSFKTCAKMKAMIFFKQLPFLPEKFNSNNLVWKNLIKEKVKF